MHVSGGCPVTQVENRRFKGDRICGVIYNTMSSFINRWLTAAIMLYDVLHSLQVGRGTGTAALNAKLL